MLRVVINRVGGCDRLSGRRWILAGVQVSVETREVAAADLESKAVALAKQVAGGPQVDGEFVGLTGIQEGRFLLGLAVTRSYNAFRQILCESVRPHIHQFRREVGVNRRRTGKQLCGDWPSNFQILGEHGGRVNKNIVASFHRTLIAGSGSEMCRVTAEWTANGGRRIRRVVDVTIRRLSMRRCGGENAISAQGIRFSSRVQKVALLAGAGQRPVVLVAPLV